VAGIYLIAVILTFCIPCTAQETSVEEILAQSVPEIQAQIDKIIEVLDPRVSQNNIPALQEIENLNDSIADQSEIVKQVAFFAAAPDADERQRLMAPVVLHFLDLPPEIVIRVLASYLDAENKNLRSFARNWFRSHDKSGSGSARLAPVNYKDYLEYVRGCLNTNQEIPAGFIEYLYGRSPDRALIIFYRAARLGDSITKMMEMRKKFDAEQQEREKDGRDAERKRVLRESLKMFEAEMRERDRNVQDPELRKKLASRWRERDKNRQNVPSLPPMPKPQPPLPDKMLQRLEKKPPKEILLAEHIISNAIWLKRNGFDKRFQKALPEARGRLSKLAEMDQWWTRLYVAEIMRRHRELRQADVLEKLSRDSNSLVSKSAKSQ